MSESRSCTECGTDLDASATREGLCPRCLLSLALSFTEGKAEATGPREFVGPYRLVRVIGEGGMGLVYLAEQVDPIRRRVALKIIRQGMDTVEVLARFDAERQALAIMDHANIARVYEAGSTSDGRPYFVMEYLEGRPVTEYCDRRRLPVRRRLELFVQICDAVQHAHQKGVLHRDLKPSNILVAEVDGKPVPKIIDFGLAKALDRKIGLASSVTQFGVLLGTPEYMSPEQLTGSEPVDTRTDVYSLGLLLYELLTGALPFDAERLREAGIDELCRVICQADAPKPSRRLIGLGARGARIAEARSVDVAGLARSLRGELEWILLKALEKQPSRRYGSASELASDIVRHLEDEPVRAGPQPPGYRIRKLVRKHWTVATATVALIVCLAAVAVVGTILYRHAEHTRTVLTAVPLTTFLGSELAPAFSPDGNQVAFRWNGENEDNWDIYVKSVGTGRPRRLTSDPAVDFSPCWSPDGGKIAFLRFTSPGFAVFAIPPVGGVERKLYETSYVTKSEFSVQLLTWTPDHKGFIISERESPSEPNALFLVEIDSGRKQRLTSPPRGYSGDADPAFSPDGKRLSFTRNRDLGQMDLYLLELTGALKPQGTPRILTDHLPFKYRDLFGQAWCEDGKEIIASVGRGMAHECQLWRIATDVETRPSRLDFTGNGASYPAVSGQAHRLAYNVAQSVRSTWVVEDPGDSKTAPIPRRLLASTRSDHQCHVSPDGHKIAFRSDSTGGFNIWVSNSDGSNPIMLTDFDGPECASPAWAPDSRSIVFDARPEGQSEVYVISAEGGSFRRITYDRSEDVMPSWSRDGRWIYFTSNRSGQWQVWKVPSEGGAPVQVTHKGGFFAQESYDGKTLFFGSDRYELGVYRMSLDGDEEATAFLPEADVTTFTPTEKGYYYWTRDRVLRFLESSTSRRRVVLEIDRAPSSFLSVFPDGRHILYSQVDRVSSDLYVVEQFR